MDRKMVYIHRVGTITFFDPYEVICFWPVLLILLGIEVLLANSRKTYRVVNEEGKVEEQEKMVYDFPAILLMITVACFSMCMAVLERVQLW